jgi:hypothetical protein
MTSAAEGLMCRSDFYRWLVVLSTAAVLWLAPPMLAQRAPQRSAEFSQFADPEGRFTLEFPRNWSWQLVVGSGEPSLILVSPKKDATVVVERFRLRQTLEPDRVTDALADVEAELLKENKPSATEVVARVDIESGKRVIVIDYWSGPKVQSEAAPFATPVRQYSYPFGRNLYRITCAAVPSQFSKSEEICTNIIKSLTPAVTPSPPPQVTARQALEKGTEFEKAGDLPTALRWFERSRLTDPSGATAATAAESINRVRARMKAEGAAALTRAKLADALTRIDQAIAAYDLAVRYLPDDDPGKQIAKSRLDALRARR